MTKIEYLNADPSASTAVDDVFITLSDGNYILVKDARDDFTAGKLDGASATGGIEIVGLNMPNFGKLAADDCPVFECPEIEIPEVATPEPICVEDIYVA